ALKGLPLRQEVYAVDDSSDSQHPYSVMSNSYTLKLLQPAEENPHAVFYACPRETLSYHYERNPANPRVGHQLTLAVDPFGNVTQSASIGYPRRSPVYEEQKPTFVTYTDARVTNMADADDWYRIGVPVETRTYDITGPLAKDVPLSFETVQTFIAGTTEIAYEQKPDSNKPQRRLIEHVRTLY